MNGNGTEETLNATFDAVVSATTIITEEVAKKPPGFECVFAISGLLAVAYLVLRQRD